MNGLNDWWESGKEMLSTVVDIADTAADYVVPGYGWMKDKAEELTNESKATLQEFEDKMDRLLKTQKEVDQAIATLPENSPARARLEAKRRESRGVFSEYILPAWEKFKVWAYDEEVDSMAGLGALPIVGIAAVLGSVSVAIYWIESNQDLEEQILADPDLKEIYAKQRGAGIAQIASLGKYAVIGGGLFAAIYVVNMFRK